LIGGDGIALCLIADKNRSAVMRTSNAAAGSAPPVQRSSADATLIPDPEKE
jgi:hypothetical protein